MTIKQLAGTLAIVAVLAFAAVGWARSDEPAPPAPQAPVASQTTQTRGSGITELERTQLAAERAEARREAREDARELREERREDALERREDARENAIERANARRGCIDD
jgi:hypothetical protein